MTETLALDGGRVLHIAIVSQYFWPEDFRINDLAAELVERGHEVTVLTGLPNYPSGTFFKNYGWFGPWHEMRNGIDIIRMPLTPRGVKNKIGLVANYMSFAIFACLLAPIRMRKKCDIIFVYQASPVTVGYPALMLAKIWKAPVFLWVLDLWPESLSASGLAASGLAQKIGRWLARPIYAYSDFVLAASTAFSESIRHTAQRHMEVRYFPQWAENQSKDVAIIFDEMPKLPSGFKVMFTGNIGVSQDFETIIAAAIALKHQKNIHWIIIGDGHHLPWLRNQIAEQNLHATVHCYGRFPSSLMHSFFVQADVLLATLRNEPVFALTVPAKIQSYLSASKPIITAINGEVMRIINESKAGIAVNAGDGLALAAAVEHMSLLPQQKRDDMGLNGKNYFDANYVKDHLIDRLIGWFREALAAQKQNTPAVSQAGKRER